LWRRDRGHRASRRARAGVREIERLTRSAAAGSPHGCLIGDRQLPATKRARCAGRGRVLGGIESIAAAAVANRRLRRLLDDRCGRRDLRLLVAALRLWWISPLLGLRLEATLRRIAGLWLPGGRGLLDRRRCGDARL